MILYEGPLPLSPSHREMCTLSRVDVRVTKSIIANKGRTIRNSASIWKEISFQKEI